VEKSLMYKVKSGSKSAHPEYRESSFFVSEKDLSVHFMTPILTGILDSSILPSDQDNACFFDYLTTLEFEDFMEKVKIEKEHFDARSTFISMRNNVNIEYKEGNISQRHYDTLLAIIDLFKQEGFISTQDFQAEGLGRIDDFLEKYIENSGGKTSHSDYDISVITEFFGVHEGESHYGPEANEFWRDCWLPFSAVIREERALKKPVESNVVSIGIM